jgi:two-component system cell cycle sensor histidine kinase/response regulator CckA
MQIEQTQFQDQLVRGLAHRMNNILTLFHGYIGILLENSSLDNATREGLNRIKDGASAASELMDRTHSLVRPSALVWREINLGQFVPMLRPLFESFCRPNSDVEISSPDELPPVWADAARVRTAIAEVVRNACEATGCGGGGKVSITVAEESGTAKHHVGLSSAAQPLNWITVTVVDNGPGIDPEAEDKIFQPFFSTKKRQNAAGLGLTVAGGMVQQLGGFIRHESRPGRTSFQIVLPARGDTIRLEE